MHYIRSAIAFTSLIIIAGISFYLVFLRHSDKSATPFWNRQARKPSLSESITVSVSTSPTTAIELPKLYSGLQWSSTESGKFLFRTHANEVVERDGYIIKSVVLVSYPNNFLAYYEQLLDTQGWIQTDTADGPDGGWYGYEKNGYFISFGVRAVSREPLKYQAVVQHNIIR